MTEPHDLLLELGCEELPAREQPVLREAGARLWAELLDAAGIPHGDIQAYVGPRRLALLTQAVAPETQARETWRRGPAVERAFINGQATPAAQGFARSCGVTPDQLQTLETDKGPVLAWCEQEPPQPSRSILPELASRWVRSLPLRKRMHWGDSDDTFSRPLRWLLFRHGDATLTWQDFGLQAQGQSFGHRVHHPAGVALPAPADYLSALRAAQVLADWDERRAHIRAELEQMGRNLDCQPLLSSALLDEITGLNEWPVVLAGHFAPDYLRVPEEVLTTVMIQHQRYVPLRQADGRLAPRYLFVANIASRDPELVIRGNDRVLNARLADAAFFWDQDGKQPLQNWVAGLDGILFQDGLGSIGDKIRRLPRLKNAMAKAMGVDPELFSTAAQLCKADLLSGMVGEFPELQGIMGGYYARVQGMDEEIARAIAEHYQPTGREDPTPASRLGQALALADKLDTLCGFFALGKVPTGDKDPFALRRAALGVLRIALEGKHHLDLKKLVHQIGGNYGADLTLWTPEAEARLQEFFQERLRVLFRDQGFAADQVSAILAAGANDPLDAQERLKQLAAFLREQDSAATLGALIKRVSNLLRKEGTNTSATLDPKLLIEPAEQALWQSWEDIRMPVADALEQRDYAATLGHLARLADPVDRFFTEVMVLCEDLQLRQQRLALLQQIQRDFMEIADFSLLQGQG